MPIVVHSILRVVAPHTFVAAHERHKGARLPSPGQKRRCVYRQYEELIPYQQVQPHLLITTLLLLGDHSPYCTLQAWQWQKTLVAASHRTDSPDCDTVLLLQHPAVYTLGAGSTTDHLHFDPKSPPHPLHRTERGGEVTYHGPGQLLLYPIMNLKHHTLDMHWYLRSLEEVVIR